MHNTIFIFIWVSFMVYNLIPQLYYLFNLWPLKISIVQRIIEFIFSFCSYWIIILILLYNLYWNDIKGSSLVSQVLLATLLIFIPITASLLRYKVLNSQQLLLSRYAIAWYTLYIYVWITLSFIIGQAVLLFLW